MRPRNFNIYTVNCFRVSWGDIRIFNKKKLDSWTGDTVLQLFDEDGGVLITECLPAYWNAANEDSKWSKLEDELYRYSNTKGMMLGKIPMIVWC